MPRRLIPALIVAVVLGAAVIFGLLGVGGDRDVARSEPPAEPPPATAGEMTLPPDHPAVGAGGSELPPDHPPIGAGGSELPPDHPPIGAGGSELPPDHPPIGAGGSPAAMSQGSDETPAIAWNVPAEWQETANPNAMRLATYRSPGGGEMSVARAGGTTEANIQRWLTQFDAAAPPTREEKTIHGLRVTTVHLAGTFKGSGMMMGNQTPEPHPGWALLGAIVETTGSSAYFFKMVGPAPAIAAARAPFDRLLASVTPR
jgi:hypothetical protein